MSPRPRHKASGESDTTATSTEPERVGTAQLLSVKVAKFPSLSHIYTPAQPPWTMANLTPALILGRIIPLVPLSRLHSNSCQYLANPLNTLRGSNGEGQMNGWIYRRTNACPDRQRNYGWTDEWTVGLSKKKNRISNISRIKKSTFECKTLHSNFRCASGSLISGARDAMKM